MAAKKPKQTLKEFRESNKGQLQKSLDKLISVRDNPDTDDKNIIESSKQIAKMMGGMTPERGSKSSSTSSASATEQLTPEEDAMVKQILPQ